MGGLFKILGRVATSDTTTGIVIAVIIGIIIIAIFVYRNKN